MSKSSEIVLNWVNNEVKLSPKIEDIKISFSNGYHIGEIFYILKLITKQEFSEFLDTDNISDKKSNFSKIEKICQKLFNLIIPEEDINGIINKHYSKAVVLLYKIRNCIYKNNIHFNDIQIFGSAFSNDEIHTQIKELIKRQFYDEEEDNTEEEKQKEKEKSRIKDKDKEKDDQLSNKNLSNISESIYKNENSLYEEERDTIKNDLILDDLRNLKSNFKMKLDNNIKEEIKIGNKNNKYINNNFKNNFRNKNIFNKVLNEKRKLPSIRILKNFNQKNIQNEQIKSKMNQIGLWGNKLAKKDLVPLIPMANKMPKNKSSENIFISQKNLNNENNLNGTFRNTGQSNLSLLFSNAFQTMNKFNLNSQLINVRQFNKRLEKLGVKNDEYKLEEDTNSSQNLNYTINTIFKNINSKSNKKNKEPFLDSLYNNKTADEVRNELKSKIKYKKIENKMRQTQLKRELSQKLISDSKAPIDFLKINKKHFYDKRQSMSLMFKDYSNKASIRRQKYGKELSEKKEKEDYQKRTFYFNNEVYKNQQEFAPILLNNQKFNEPEKEETFNSKRFFEKLEKLNYLTNLVECEKKHKIRDKHMKIIKEIVLYIIDMTMESYFYQRQTKQDLIDMDTYLKFNIYFLKNKILREKVKIIEDNERKKPNKFELDVDIEKLTSSLTNEEKYLIKDYIYYLGIWNEDRIYDNKLKGLKLEYKYIDTNDNNNNVTSVNNNYFGITDYEPTALEIEDLTLPKYNLGNYIFGNSILEILEQKFNTNDNSVINNQIKNENNLNNMNSDIKSFSKWDYIPYKIALVGYPLSGRKTISERINNKYPNMKVYSIYKIIREYYQLFIKLSDPPEKPNKNKNSKKNVKKNEKDKETISEKKERHRKLKEFQPIINLIQPYIDYQQNNNITTSSRNNTSRNATISNNNNNVCGPFIMPDEILCQLLIRKIEEDFPYITPEALNNQSVEAQKKIYDLENKIEVIRKRKEEEKKPNPKDDQNIETIENEIKSLKENSISGFILTDFPSNINQCYLLENYLTGFIEDKRKPKLEENKIIENISSIIDFKMQPKEKKTDKKSGLDFVVHLSTKENIVNERFKSIKYDPVDDIIYTKSNSITDKNIIERLVDEIPYLSKEQFEYYKDEYNNNINKIISLYNQFGFIINSEKDEFKIVNPNINNNDTKEIIKTYQFIESEEMHQITVSDDKNKKNKKNVSKTKKNIKERNKDKSLDKEKSMITTNSNENPNKDKVYNFICFNLIEKLFKEKEKNEKELFYNAYPEYKAQYQNSINFEPDLNINEIKTRYKNKSTKKADKDFKIIDYEPLKINNLFNDLNSINIKYNKYLGKFIHFTLQQKKDFYSRLNLAQTKFRNFINTGSNKKKIISNYVKKYNHLYSINPDLLDNDKVIKELVSDIEDLRTEIIDIINKKQKLSINELKEIYHCGFIEAELYKFYLHIKDLILLETEKFVTILNNMIIIYTKKREKDKEKEKNIMEFINEIKNGIPDKIESISHNIKPIKYTLNFKKEPKFELTLDEMTQIIFSNIEIMFKNCIKLLFSYNKYIGNILKRLKEIIYNNLTHRKTLQFKKRRKNSEKRLYSVAMVNDLLTNKDMGYIQEENMKKMFLDEKNKYKYRICYIKSFAIKYIQILEGTNENVFNNMDDWIVKNVTLQSESLGYLIRILKQFLNDKKPIDQQNDIDYIELDEFEKVIEDEEINSNMNIQDNSKIRQINNYNSSIISNNNGSNHDFKLKPYDNSSVVTMNRIYNKLKLEYLINDSFLDTKIEENSDNISKKSKQISKIKITPPPPMLTTPVAAQENNFGNSSSNNGDLNMSKGLVRNKNVLNDIDFYFDIEKFKFIYRIIKKYEVEDGLISKELFLQIFIKNFIFTRKKNLQKNTKKEDEDNDNDNNDNYQDDIFEYDKNINININDFYNEEIYIEHKYNPISDSNSIYPAISKALKGLRTKQIQRIFDVFVVNINQMNYIDMEKERQKDKEYFKKLEDELNKEEEMDKRRKSKKASMIKNENLKLKEKEKSPSMGKDKDNKNENNLEEQKDTEHQNISIKDKIEEKEKDINIEYETYLGTKEIFTILSLIGVNILNSEIEEKIEKELKDKYIMDKYLTKKDFMEYIFWFEPFFEYINDKSKRDNDKSIINNKSIKEFLFDIWKNDDNSTYFDFKKFLDVLRSNRYVTDLTNNEVRYYDIIFEK